MSQFNKYTSFLPKKVPWRFFSYAETQLILTLLFSERNHVVLGFITLPLLSTFKQIILLGNNKFSIYKH